ncbi:GGDEF domain-containing protein [Alteromonas sediminis]|uniref:diguanylate cyclase n=1 Tax=Alteromonas sediminis TaxID=2259342 RepID=A0A3N5Y3I7_9ALTE|nr:GGDEF domain-containing protein [Alteromonas sediminis]RPJ68607.1 GGDEF domain-containing protein [Alteromonas sediminis]
MISDKLRQFIKAGSNPSFSEEDNRRIVVVNLFGFTGCLITVFLSLRALLANEVMLGAALMIASVVFLFSMLTMHISENVKSHVFAANLLVVTLMTLLLYLIIMGGKANTGPIWILILPPVTLFMSGLKRGLWMLLLFLLVICTLFFVPGLSIVEADYAMDFKTRVTYVFMTVTFLSSVYEYSRQQTYAEIHALRQQFEHQATHDPLTHLFNRRGLIKQIEPELARAKRQQSSTALVLLDIDRFKRINDEYGHDAGDKVLQGIAVLLNNAMRQQDYVSRWGGEEFLLVLPDTSKENAYHVADKLRFEIAQTPQQFESFTIDITASFGVSEVNSLVDYDKALTQADKAMYKAKQAGRNTVMMSN